MKRTLTILALGTVLIAVSYWNLHNRPHTHRPKQSVDETATPQAGSTSSNSKVAPLPSPASGSSAPAQATASVPFPATTRPRNERESLEDLVKVLFIATRPGQPMNALVDYLKSTAQDPYLVKNSNKYTGELTFVRTNSPFPGTRYFHAQYFSDENGQPFAQHISFEFKPGPDSMNQAVAAIQKSFPNLGAAHTREKGAFSEWDAGGGYTVWIRRLTSEDIRRSEDPYSVHTAADVGTVVIAVELNPEHDEEHGH